MLPHGRPNECVVAVSKLDCLDAAWVYLIDPAARTINVHHADSGESPRHPLAG